jgi:hypothetical protein
LVLISKEICGFESDVIAVGEEENGEIVDGNSQFISEDGPKLKALLSEDSVSEDDDQADNDIESISTCQKRKAEVSKYFKRH